MLGHQYPRQGFRTITYGGRPASTTGTNVPAGAAPHTLGASFTELVTALPYDIRWLTITISGTATPATQTDALLSLYTGAAGSEQLWIRNLLAGWSGAIGTDSAIPKIYEFPLTLPVGTRISAKSQALVASQACRVWLEYSSDRNRDGWAGSGVRSIGNSNATSRGVAVTPGAASDGTWTDLATTDRAYAYMLPMIQGGMTNTVLSTAMYHLDIGTGGAVIEGLEDFPYFAWTGETLSQVFTVGKFVPVALGTPVQVRVQTSGSDTLPVDCSVYGVF